VAVLRGELRPGGQVFKGGTSELLNGIARMAVLYEDLRIEIAELRTIQKEHEQTGAPLPDYCVTYYLRRRPGSDPRSARRGQGRFARRRQRAARQGLQGGRRADQLVTSINPGVVQFVQAHSEELIASPRPSTRRPLPPADPASVADAGKRSRPSC
jgi:hypothetical protein